jgi:hypothetical protein
VFNKSVLSPMLSLTNRTSTSTCRGSISSRRMYQRLHRCQRPRFNSSQISITRTISQCRLFQTLSRRMLI